MQTLQGFEKDKQIKYFGAHGRKLRDSMFARQAEENKIVNASVGMDQEIEDDEYDQNSVSYRLQKIMRKIDKPVPDLDQTMHTMQELFGGQEHPELEPDEDGHELAGRRTITKKRETKAKAKEHKSLASKSKREFAQGSWGEDEK